MKKLAPNTLANRRWYGGGIPVAVEPHQFWPMGQEERKRARRAMTLAERETFGMMLPIGLNCRECKAPGLFGKDGKYRHLGR